MLYCNECGNELREGSPLCSECGASLALDARANAPGIAEKLAQNPYSSSHWEDNDVELEEPSLEDSGICNEAGINNDQTYPQVGDAHRTEKTSPSQSYLPLIALIGLIGFLAIIIAVAAASSKTDTQPSVVQTPVTRYVVITAINANVRNQPTTRGNSIAILSSGTRVQFVTGVNGWFQIRLSDGRTGFISGSVGRVE